MGSPCSSCENAAQDGKLSHRSMPSTRKSISMEPIGIGTWDQFQTNYEDYPKSFKQSGRALFFVKRSSTDAVTFACRCLTKEQVPVREPRVLSRYMARLSGLEHPHICKFVESFENEKNIFCIYEKAEPISLLTHIQKRKSFMEHDAADCIRQLAMAFAVAHDQDICHGRLTISDVVMSSQDERSQREDEGPQLKVCDMGLSGILQPGAMDMAFPNRSIDSWDDSFRSRQMRLVSSMPPEVAWGETEQPLPKGALPETGIKLDIWAIGVIAYYILCGRPPFAPQQGDSPKRVLQDIQSGAVIFVDSEWANYPVEARDCVEDLLKINAALRPDARHVLKHAWLRLQAEKVPRAKMVRVLKNIRHNVSHGPLKRVVLRIISQSHLGEEQTIEAEQVFRALDRNGDGVLGEAEIEKAVEKFFQEHSPRYCSESEDLFGKLDRDGTGTVNLEEFIAAAVRQSDVLTPQAMWSVFHALDQDGSGTITLQEIQDMVLHLDAGLVASSQTASLLSEVSDMVSVEAGSGAMLEPITFDEFVDLMTMQADQARGWWQSLKRGTRAKMRIGFGIDVYGTASQEIKEFDWDRQPRSPKSAYNRLNAKGSRQSVLKKGNGKSVLLVGAPEDGLPPPPRPPTPEREFETCFKEVEAAAAAAAASGETAAKPCKRSPRKDASPGTSPRDNSPGTPPSPSPRASRSPRKEKDEDRSPRKEKEDRSPRKEGKPPRSKKSKAA